MKFNYPRSIVLACRPQWKRSQDLLFEAIYSNDPHTLMTPRSVVKLCGLAHKYGATELERASLLACRKLIKTAKLTGSTPTIPELLVLGQKVKDKGLLGGIIKRGMDSFCAPSDMVPLPALYCPNHGYEPIHSCQYCCKPPPPPAVLDAAAKKLLTSLNPSTLVAIISALVASQRRLQY